MKLLIHAPNVHQGGGGTLLLALLVAKSDRVELYAVVDERLQVPPHVPDGRILARVPPTIGGRIAAEWRLRTLLGSEDALLCFGNLPPLFGASGRVVLFLQNRYLTGRRGARHLAGRTRLRVQLERIWLRSRLSCVDHIVVQTPSMAREVRQELGAEALVVPYMGECPKPADGVALRRPIDRDTAEFLYVASGEPHKNHRVLLAAWQLLGQQGIFPTLTLTLDAARDSTLCAEIEEERSKHGLAIDNLGAVPASVLAELYSRCTALIYPSSFESFGVPLLEARAHGLPILAAERDYVRDVVEPIETFDPDSPLSIARSVKRFLGLADERVRIRTAEEFIRALSDGTVFDR